MLLRFLTANFFLACIILFSAALLFTPSPHAAFAQSTGLVQCGLQYGSGDQTNTCTICDLFKLLQRILYDLIIYIAAPAAALMMSYVGLLFMLHGQSQGRINQDKKILKQIVTGIVIIFVGWLAIDTIMKVFGAQYGKIEDLGPWNTIKCTAPPVPKPIIPI